MLLLILLLIKREAELATLLKFLYNRLHKKNCIMLIKTRRMLHWEMILYLFQGTQSSNPHNDYCQHFVDTGQRPQNFIRDVGLADRFEEYPKLRELIKLKDDLIAQTAVPPMYLKCDLKVGIDYY